MANISFANIRKAVRERIEGTLTSVRDISAGRFVGGYWIDMNDPEQKRRSLVNPRYEVRVTRTERHPSSPPTNSSVSFINMELQVITSYRLDNPVLDDDVRDAIRAVAETDTDILQQGLGWADAIDQTSAGGATGLVSGVLRWEGSELDREEWGEGTEDGAGLLEMTHTFTGIVNVTQATT